MKTKSLLLSLLLVVGIIAINSCSKDDDPAPLSQEDAVIAIDDANADFEATTTDLQTNDGYELQQQLYDMYLPFYGYYKASKKIYGNVDVKTLKEKTSNYFKSSKVEDVEFHFEYLFDIYFEDYTGTWEWTNGEFVKTSESPANEIVAKFPFNSDTNNATLRYYDYKYNSDTEQMTGLKCEIKVGSEVKLLVVYSASMSESMTSFSMSQKYDATFGQYNYVQDVSMSASGSETSAKATVNGSVTIKKSGETKYRESVNFVMNFSDQNASYVYDARLLISNIEIRLKMEFDADEAEDIYYGSVDPSEYIQMSIYTASGAKVGDFKFKEVNGEWMPYFVFSDGTEVSAEEALGTIFGRMGSFYEDLFELMYIFNK